MARYYIDFRGFTDGGFVQSGWKWGQANGGYSASVSSAPWGKVVTVNSSTAGTKILSPNVVDGFNDIEGLIKFRFSSASGKQGILSLRYGGNTEANTTGYTLSGSFISGAGQLAIDEGQTGYVTWTPWNYLSGINYWARFRVIGNTMKAKVWADGSPEPSSWMIDITNTARPTGSYSGIHQYGIGAVTVENLSFATDGDTAVPYDDWTKTQSGIFKVNTLAASTDVGGYSAGFGGVAGYGGSFGTAFVPTSTINDKTQTGLFRVKKDITNNQLGKFRIKQTYSVSQSGLFRVRTTSNITQSGQFRISSEPSRLQSGKFRIQTANDKSQNGRFIVSAITIQDQEGLFRVQTAPSKNQLGKFTVIGTTTRNQDGLFRVRTSSSFNQIGQFRVNTTSNKTISGKFRLSAKQDKNQSGQFKVENLRTNNQLGKFRVYGKNTIQEVFIPESRYIAREGSQGVVQTAEANSGSIFESINKTDNLLIASSPIVEKDYKANGTVVGKILSNNEYTVMLFEPEFKWLSEDTLYVIIEENNIINMIPKKGTFTAGEAEHGRLQEVI